MTTKFDEQLAALKSRVAAMGYCAQRMFQTAMQALGQRDPSLFTDVRTLEDRVDRYQIEIDEAVVSLMTEHTPSASGLRVALMIARINTELERIGDQSVNMCENIQLLVSESKAEVPIELHRMADISANMLQVAMKAFGEGSHERAREVITADNMVDALDDQIFRDLLDVMTSERSQAPRCVALLLTARALERIADHATNVAEEVIYMVKGEDVRHPRVR